MTDKELFREYAASTFQSERYETLHEEINRRVRAEIVAQLDSSAAGERERTAILRGFDESATWHFDAARKNDFATTIKKAVENYLSKELTA